MPLLLLHPKPNPFMFIVKVFLPLVWPYPTLFLNVTISKLVSQPDQILCVGKGKKDGLSKPLMMQLLSSVRGKEDLTYKKLPGNIR